MCVFVDMYNNKRDNIERSWHSPSLLERAHPVASQQDRARGVFRSLAWSSNKVSLQANFSETCIDTAVNGEGDGCPLSCVYLTSHAEGLGIDTPLQEQQVG